MTEETKKEKRERRLRNFGGKEGEGGTPDSSGRGLSTRIPNPNILRIEVLDGKARERYLTGVQRIADTVKQATYRTIKNKGEDTFYGFIKYTGAQSYGISANWEQSAAGGGILGSIKKLVGTKVTSFVDTSLDIANDITGINAKVNGSSSMKRYGGGGLSNGFSVTCGWYLPEQFLLCVKSLRILHKMVYPTKIDSGKLGDEAKKAIKELANKISNTWLGEKVTNAATATAEAVRFFGNLGAAQTSAYTLNTNNIANSPAEKAPEDANKDKDPFNIVSTIEKGFEIMGNELTFDPLPVRLSIGQYMDLEPLVITNMKIDLSQESFINKEGRHVPVTCSATIEFKFWMNPAPDLHFVSLFGHEMFGKTEESDEASKNLVNTYKTGE